MFISKIRIKNFRNFVDSEIQFNEGVNVIIGHNNSGKSNLIRALSLVIDYQGLKKLDILEDSLYRLMKLILFYLWNVSKILGEEESNILNDFIISDEYVYYNLAYDIKKFTSDEELKSLIISNKNEMLNKSQRPDFAIGASSLIRHSSFGFRHSTSLKG